MISNKLIWMINPFVHQMKPLHYPTNKISFCPSGEPMKNRNLKPTLNVGYYLVTTSSKRFFCPSWQHWLWKQRRQFLRVRADGTRQRELCNHSFAGVQERFLTSLECPEVQSGDFTHWWDGIAETNLYLS